VADDKSKARSLDSEATVLADVRIDALRVGKRHLTYRSSCHDLSPGMCFQMVHPRDDLNQSVLLAIESHIHGKHDGEWVLRGHAVFTDDYYKPQLRMRKPKISGLQSAIVVGPPGQEIYTDEFGRVRVRFHWDREGDFDDNRTCWLRVSQDWAGPMYGGLRLPRIDQEVLVDFLEGDPDNPIVVGRLFNATNQVPYPLPKRKTVSTYKSDTSPHDGGFNEILFEDMAGAEYVYVQAEKDLWKLVKHDEREETGNDRTLQVGDTQQTFVGAVDATSAGVQHDVTVGKTSVKKLDKKIVATVGEATFTLDGPNVTIVASGGLQFKAEGTLSIEGGPDVYVNCDDAPAALWDQYRKASEDVIAAAQDEPRARNQIIGGAWADLFLNNPKFPWAEVLAYQAAAAAAGMIASDSIGAIAGMAEDDASAFASAVLATADTALFLDAYSMALLYQDHPDDFGDYADKLGLPSYAKDGFGSADGAAITAHQQDNAAQKQAFNDAAVPGSGALGATPADPPKTDLGAMRAQGVAAGGQYPTSPAGVA
jgi:hypothetical protein